MEMEEYLSIWWAGELALNYKPLGFEIHQLNKMFKIAQYLLGLLGIFEIVHFSAVMNQFGFVAKSYYFLNRLPWLILNTPIRLIPKLLSAAVSVAQGKIETKDMYELIIVPEIGNKIRRVEADAEEGGVVKALRWLENHPPSDRSRRVFLFFGFVITSMGELFTS